MKDRATGLGLVGLILAVVFSGFAYSILHSVQSGGVGSASVYVHDWQEVTVLSEQEMVNMEVHADAPFKLIGADGTVIAATDPSIPPLWWDNYFNYYGYTAPTKVKPQVWEVDADGSTVQLIVIAEGRVAITGKFPTWAIVTFGGMILVIYMLTMLAIWIIMVAIDGAQLRYPTESKQ